MGPLEVIVVVAVVATIGFICARIGRWAARPERGTAAKVVAFIVAWCLGTLFIGVPAFIVGWNLERRRARAAVVVAA